MWTSRLQTDIAFSMTEVEYIVLSQSMHDLLSTKALVQEVVEGFGINPFYGVQRQPRGHNFGKCTMNDTTHKVYHIEVSFLP